jgi:protoporphyrinogen oxidase
VVDLAILGSGPCGLGAAWQIERLQAAGHDISYAVIDRNSAPGGSASSVTTPEGFTFDFGGHILYPHQHYSEFSALLRELVPAWHESVPVRGVWIDRQLVPYPVQRNIHRLMASKLVPAITGVAEAKLRKLFRRNEANDHTQPSLQSYLVAEFGIGLTNLVLGPLNTKMWAHPLTELSSNWTSQRSGSTAPNVALISLRQILRSIVTRKDNLGWTPSTRVQYPARGGSGSIWTSLASRLSPHAFRQNARVVQIDTEAQTLSFEDRSQLRYRHLLSTIPLDSLLRLIASPMTKSQTAQKLRFSRAVFAGFGIEGRPPDHLAQVHSFHVPDPSIPCWRITLPAALSPGNVPSHEHYSMLAEVSLPESEVPDVAAISATIEHKLLGLGLIGSHNKIISRWSAEMRHGYPVPFLDRDSMLQDIDSELKRSHILSRGRFGGWKYEVSNQDHSFMQGVEAVDFLISGKPEETYRFPAAVN